MFLEQHPTGNTRRNQYAGGYCKQRALSPEFVRFSESRKVAVAWAARAEVIEPLLRLSEWHPARCDSLKHVSAGASGTLRIWKLFEQTSTQRVEDASFVLRGISLFVQACLPLRIPSTTARIYIELTSAGLLRVSPS